MRLSLVSSNIRFDSPNDGDHRWDCRKKLLSSILLKDNPDIIATQEGRQPQLRDLESLLPDYKIADQHRDWIAERMYPSIYYKNTNTKILDSGDIWLSETPGLPGSSSFKSIFPRLCSWVKCQKEKQQFYYYNLHLDHILDETRINQIKVLIEERKKINIEKLPIIIGGDFNNPAGGDLYKLLLNQIPHLYDPWKKLGHSEETSYHHFDGTHEKGSRIDWILVDKRFTTQEIYFDKTQLENLYPSDHFPLKCFLELKS